MAPKPGLITLSQGIRYDPESKIQPEALLFGRHYDLLKMRRNFSFGFFPKTRSVSLLISLFVFIGVLLMPFAYSSAQVLFHDGFEGGDLSKWSFAVPKAEISNRVVYTGKSALHIPYDVPEGDPAHRDCNRFVEVDLSNFDIDHFFVRGYFYLASTATPTAARKLYYIFSYPHTDPKWDVMVSVNGGKNGGPLSFSIGSNLYGYSDLRYPKWNIAEGKLHYDTWYCLELEIRLNTPGVKDGAARLWLNGELMYEKENISIRDDNKPLGIVRVGAQIDRHGDTLERHEDRYWDDIVISTTYVGPINSTLGEVLHPPTNLRHQQ